jgi:hypothetical protein
MGSCGQRPPQSKVRLAEARSWVPTMRRISTSLIALAVIVTADAAQAQTNVTLPSASELTTLTAAVAEQADVSLPVAVSFTVNDVNAQTSQTNLEMTVSNIVLATATKQFRISLQANADTFAPPATTSITWNASAVSWSFTGGSPWTNGTGTAGTLSHLAYNTVATCNAGVSSCSTNRLKLTLDANPSINRSGAYTLLITWKVESIGT